METQTDSSTGAIIKSDRTGRNRYTAQYKREVLDAFESSSLSAPAFAMQCGVKYPTFAAWIAGRRRGSLPGPARQRSDAPAFLRGRESSIQRDWQYSEGLAVFQSLARQDGKTEAADAGRYIVKNGVIAVTFPDETDKLTGQLYTVAEFPKNFVLKLEFRASVNADSGIFIRKPQLQCRDYLVAGPYLELKQYKPQEWNQIEVTVKDGVAQCTCNGEVLEAALALPANGPIGLEGDRGVMEYRRIRIKELP